MSIVVESIAVRSIVAETIVPGFIVAESTDARSIVW